MKTIEIENVNKIANEILAGKIFDSFLLVEAEISVISDFNIDGRINKKFLDEEELDNSEDFIEWKKVKKLCYDVIKGKKMPLSMKYIFKLSDSKIPAFLKSNQIEGVASETVKGLFMNIKYENGKMDCVTGTSLSTFDLNDRRVEEAWDETVKKFILKIEG